MSKSFSVIIGSDEIDKGEEIDTKRIAIHPDSDMDGILYDFALVFLEKSASSNIPLVRLNPSESYPNVGATATTMGWGDMDTGWSVELPDRLMAVDLRVMSNTQCQEMEQTNGDSYESMKMTVDSSMICTYTQGKMNDVGLCYQNVAR